MWSHATWLLGHKVIDQVQTALTIGCRLSKRLSWQNFWRTEWAMRLADVHLFSNGRHVLMAGAWSNSDERCIWALCCPTRSTLLACYSSLLRSAAKWQSFMHHFHMKVRPLMWLRASKESQFNLCVYFLINSCDLCGYGICGCLLRTLHTYIVYI